METKEECNPNNQYNDCEFCMGADDEKFLVCITPRRFGLPHSSEKKAKMELQNKNQYPIYFKAETSNFSAFRPHPNTGRIPPNGTVYVTVQFYDSVRPLRRHEEVVIWTSIRPFEQMPQYGNVCNYCYGDIHSHNYSQKIICQPEPFCDRKEYRYFPVNGPPRHSAFHESNSYQKSKDIIYNREERTVNKESVYAGSPEKHFEPPCAKIRHIMHGTIDERPEFEEICLHALIHRTASRQCECKNCGDIILNQRHDERTEAKYRTFIGGRRLSDPTLSVSDSKKLENNKFAKRLEAKVQKETLKDEGRERLKIDAKEKSKGAHILTRIKEKDSIEATDTETSDLSSRYKKQKMRSKIISEEDFKKKLAKAKLKKYRRQLKDESQSTTTSTATTVLSPVKEVKKPLQKKSPKKVQESRRSPEKIQKSPAVAIIANKDSECTIVTVNCPLEKVTWINLALLILLLIIVVVFFTYTFFAMKYGYNHHTRCFFDFFSSHSLAN